MSLIRLVIAFFLILVLCNPALADFEVELNKGLAAYLRGDYEQAVQVLEGALQKQPESATANHFLGLSLYRLERYEESIPYLERARSLDPNLEDINLDLGSAYLRTENYEGALSEFEEALRRDTDSSVAYYNLGYTNYKLGKYREAISALEKAAELDPELAPQAEFYLGISRYKLAEYDPAKINFESVINLRPESDLATAAEQYLNAMSRFTKKYYGTVSSGVQYDDNVVLEPDEVQITDQSDVRGFFFVNLGYKPYLKPDSVIGGDYKGFFSFHKDLEDLNIQNHKFTLFGEKRVSVNERPLALYLEYFYDLVLVDGSPADDLFSQTHSVLPRVTYEWTDRTSTEFTYWVRYDNFEDFPERDAINNHVSIGQIFRFYEGRLYVKPGFGFAINSADDISGTRNFDYYSPRFFLESLAFLPYELTIFAELHYFHEDYYNDDFDRKDDQINARVVLSKKLYKILFLDLGYQHVSNFSNSDFPGPEPFEYNRNIFSAALSARF